MSPAGEVEMSLYPVFHQTWRDDAGGGADPASWSGLVATLCALAGQPWHLGTVPEAAVKSGKPLRCKVAIDPALEAMKPPAQRKNNAAPAHFSRVLWWRPRLRGGEPKAVE
jgi:hypothetical protein